MSFLPACPPIRLPARFSALSALSFSALLVSCSTASGDPDMSVRIQATAGSNQFAPPGSPLPEQIGLRVVQGSSPLANATVTFTTSDGSIAPASGVTNSDGVIAVSWTLPSGGTVPRVVSAKASVEDGPEAGFSAFIVPAANAVISITNNQFMPVPRTIAAGTTVTWLWYDTAEGHNVTPLGLEPARSGNLTDGPAVYSFTFPTSGNYTYYCEQHGTPGGTGMAGVVVVTPP